MESNDPLLANKSFKPGYLIPPVIIGVIVFFATLFGTLFVILPLVIEQDPSKWLIAGGCAGALVVVVSWWWAFRTWQIRNRLSNCRLHLKGDVVQPNSPCHFTITGLDQTPMPRFSLSYQNRLRRRSGRKVYLRGPYSVEADVHAEIEVDQQEPQLHGRFLLEPEQVKPRPPDENWLARTVILFKMSVPGTGSCRFELPYLEDSDEDQVEIHQAPDFRRSILERLLGQ